MGEDNFPFSIRLDIGMLIAIARDLGKIEYIIKNFTPNNPETVEFANNRLNEMRDMLNKQKKILEQDIMEEISKN